MPKALTCLGPLKFMIPLIEIFFEMGNAHLLDNINCLSGDKVRNNGFEEEYEADTNE